MNEKREETMEYSPNYIPSNIMVSFDDIQNIIPNPDEARKFIEQHRWGEDATPVCPYCNTTDVLARKAPREGYYVCRHCHKEFTVRTGTPMERSHIPLNLWIYAMYLVVISRKSLTCRYLATLLGIDLKSAHFMLKRLREGLSTLGFVLSGIVQSDEAYIGGRERNRHKNSKKNNGKRGVANKQAVIGLREQDGNVIMKVLDDTTQDTIMDAIRTHVKPGSVIYTDEASQYDDAILKLNGYAHKSVDHSSQNFVNYEEVYDNNGRLFHKIITTNDTESIWAVLKRGIIGVHHHISRRWLQLYLNEYAFRLNKGGSHIRILDRINAFLDMVIKSPKITATGFSDKYPKVNTEYTRTNGTAYHSQLHRN